MDELGQIGSVGSGGATQSARPSVAAAPPPPPPQQQAAAPPPAADRAQISPEAREAGPGGAPSGFLSALKQNVQGPANEQPKGLQRGEGMSGQRPSDQVRSLQRDLKARGFDVGKSGADGRFGGDTETALKAAQKKLGLPETGVADPNTLEALSKMPSSQAGQGHGRADAPKASGGGKTDAPEVKPGDGAAHRVKSTAYFPYDNKMEGGHREAYPPGDGRKAGAVNTIDDWHNNRHWDLKSNSYKEGRPPYVTVAGDPKLKGKNLTIDQFPGVPFKVMDTGGRFKNAGWNRLDIAVGSHDASYRSNHRRSVQDQFNGHLTVRESKD